MYAISQGSTQLQSIFGGTYVPEQHCEQPCGHFLTEDGGSAVGFDAILNALRSALSLRAHP